MSIVSLGYANSIGFDEKLVLYKIILGFRNKRLVSIWNGEEDHILADKRSLSGKVKWYGLK